MTLFQMERVMGLWENLIDHWFQLEIYFSDKNHAFYFTIILLFENYLLPRRESSDRRLKQCLSPHQYAPWLQRQVNKIIFQLVMVLFHIRPKTQALLTEFNQEISSEEKKNSKMHKTTASVLCWEDYIRETNYYRIEWSYLVSSQHP